MRCNVDSWQRCTTSSNDLQERCEKARNVKHSIVEFDLDTCQKQISICLKLCLYLLERMDVFVEAFISKCKHRMMFWCSILQPIIMRLTNIDCAIFLQIICYAAIIILELSFRIFDVEISYLKWALCVVCVFQG